MILLAGALLAVAPAAEANACAERLRMVGHELRHGNYQVAEAEGHVEAIHAESYGRIVIRYRCDPQLRASIENQGLPNIPFHVLLAAGPDAELVQSSEMPAWLSARQRALEP